MRILYYAINGSGIGHLMRLSAIAMTVRRQAPDVHQFLATSANYPAHLKRLKLPTLILPSDDSGSHSETDRRARTVSAQLTARILRHTIREYDPQVVVVDTHAPRRIVEDVRSEGRQAVLVFRRCREEYVAEYLRNGFLASFNLILLPYTEAEFASGMSAEMLAQLAELGTVRYTGGIAFSPELKKADTDAAARRYGVRADDTLLVITAGSGGYGPLNQRFLANAARAASSLRKKRRSVVAICVAGPYAPASVAADGCIYVESDPDLQLLVARSDLVVAHAGYNSIQEILRTGPRAILVPVHRRAEDQAAFANCLAARGRVKVLAPTSSAAAFLRAYQELLDKPRPRREKVAGADVAAAEILSLASPPEHYMCCRDESAGNGAKSFSTARQLAQALTRSGQGKALVRIDWDKVETLLERLRPEMHSRLAGLEVDLGGDGIDDLVSRGAWVYQMVEHAGFDRDALVFSLEDSSGGSLLAELTQRIQPFRFRALVARIPSEILSQDPTVVFESLELCRGLRVEFKVDVTVTGEGFVSVDQA